jgi:hypothetical protein
MLLFTTFGLPPSSYSYDFDVDKMTDAAATFGSFLPPSCIVRHEQFSFILGASLIRLPPTPWFL